MPTAMVGHPRTMIALAKLKEGVASSINPVRVPALVEPIKQYMTTGISIALSPGTASTLYLGDFTQLIFGIRTELRIEVLSELLAVNHQYGFVAHMRATSDFSIRRASVELHGSCPNHELTNYGIYRIKRKGRAVNAAPETVKQLAWNTTPTPRFCQAEDIWDPDRVTAPVIR